MWYVIQTLGGEEEKTAHVIRKQISSYYVEECFVLKRERMKKFRGCWNKMEEVLFHGYVFVISERPRELYEELRRIPRLTKVLGREDNYFFSLQEKEEKMIQEIGNQEHKSLLSRVLIKEGKKIHVIEGPLKNYEGNIVKVDLHKREVTVRLEFMGKPVELYMGIEMVDIDKDSDN